MKEAIATQVFIGRPDDAPKPIRIVEGQTVFGELAEVAISNGWAKPAGEEAEAEAPKPKRGRKSKAKADDDDDAGDDDKGDGEGE